jgi:tRNA (adenine37-N6)-methyltransferase
LDGPICTITVFAPWLEALEGIQAYERLEELYWLHQSRRDLFRQSPAHECMKSGTVALRSPVRPNPIGSSLVKLVGIDGPTLSVQGLDYIDGTPLLDIKPDRCSFTSE